MTLIWCSLHVTLSGFKCEYTQDQSGSGTGINGYRVAVDCGKNETTSSLKNIK